MVQTRKNKRFGALALAIVMLLCLIPATSFADTPETSNTLDGWTVYSTWNNLKTDYVWNATRKETRQPKMVFTYRIDKAEKTYNPGDLKFSVPGIGAAVRGTIAQASDIAAASESSEWDYTWNQDSDLYEFTNKFTVKIGDSISGGFEFLWTINTRDAVNGYTYTGIPQFTVKDVGTINLPALSYSFTSEKDKHTIDLRVKNFTADEWEESDKSYVFYDLSVTINTETHARGLYRSALKTTITLPAGTSIENVQGISADEYTMEGDNVYVVTGVPSTLGFLVSEFESKTVHIAVHYDRLFEDEEGWETETTDEVDDSVDILVRPYIYNFTGSVYGLGKWNPYGYNYLTYQSRWNSLNLYNGSLLRFTIYGTAKRQYNTIAGDPGIDGPSMDEPSVDESFIDEPPEDMNSTIVETTAEDWNDVFWKDHGLGDVVEGAAGGLTYADIYGLKEPQIDQEPSTEENGTGSLEDPDTPIDETRDDNSEENVPTDPQVEPEPNLGFDGPEIFDDPYTNNSESSETSPDREEVGSDVNVTEDENEPIPSETAPSETDNDVPTTSDEYDNADSNDQMQNGSDEDNSENTPVPETNSEENKDNGMLPEGPEFDGQITPPSNSDQSSTVTSSDDEGNDTGAPMPTAAPSDGIGESDSWNMVLGDDKMLITLKDGAMRALRDDEYNIAYVTVPSTSKVYTYNVFAAKSQDTPFDEYTYVGSGTTESSKTFTLDAEADYSAVYVQFDNIVGSYSNYIYVGVRFHLDWMSDLLDPNPINPEGYVINFSFFRAMYGDFDNSSNSLIYGAYPELQDRDLSLYGAPVFRKENYVYLRTSITHVTSTLSYDSFEKNDDIFSSRISSSWTIKADTESTLTKFSIYTEIPENTSVDYDGELTVTGSATTISDTTIDNLLNYASFSEVTRNGHKYLVVDFDFTNAPLESLNPINLRISFPIILRYADYAAVENYFESTAYLMIHDNGIARMAGYNIATDSGDLDGDSHTSEFTASTGPTVRYVSDEAVEWREAANMYVSTSFSNGYTNNSVVKRSQSDDDSQETMYTYRLDYEVGADNAKDIVFYDILDQGATVAGAGGLSTETMTSDWQGTFVSLDVSQIQSLGGVVTVYYSKDANQKKDISDGGWSIEQPEDLSEIKAVAVYVDTSKIGEGYLSPRMKAHLYITMKAPSNSAYVNKQAVNQFTVTYKGYSITGVYTKDYTLESAPTVLTLQNGVSQVIFQNYDADNVLRTAPDGTPVYAAMNEGKIQVYNKAGAPLFEEGGKKINFLGQVVADGLDDGEYTWEISEMPKGYRVDAGSREITVSGSSVVIQVMYHQIPGEVDLTLEDAQFSGYKDLEGGRFEVYKSTGEQVYFSADGKYVGTNAGDPGVIDSLVTDNDGKIHIEGMPWGSYYFVQTEAPAGYNPYSDNINFSVNKENYDAATGKVSTKVTVKNSEKPATLRLTLTDSTDKGFISDTVFDLFRVKRGGEVSDMQINSTPLRTNKVGEIEVPGLMFGEYYFRERRNATGYKLPEGDAVNSTHVTLNASTVEQTILITMENDRRDGSVEMLKVDDFDQPVEGAVYDLYFRADTAAPGSKFNVLQSLTTNHDGIITATGLKWGEYYFLEKTAPEGYSVSEEHIEFVIDQMSVETKKYLDAVDNRALGTVKLKNVDKTDKDHPIEGAEYDLYSSDGKKLIPGEDYTTNREDNRIVTGADGSSTIEGLKQGSYFFKETKPGDGYSPNSDLSRFSVTLENVEIVQTIVVESSKDKVVLSVNVEVDDVYSEFGNPTMVYVVTDESGNNLIKTATLSEKNKTDVVVFTVDANHKYTVTQLTVSRYGLSSIEDGANTVSHNLSQASATVNLTGGNTAASVTFKSKLMNYGGLSHTASRINLVKTGKRLTSISVDYTGPESISESTPGYDRTEQWYSFTEKDMSVTAYYDDGTSTVLSWDDYSLDPNYVDGNNNPSATVTVTYSENGLTATDSFNVALSLPSVKRYTIILDCNGGQISTDGLEGTGWEVVE